MKLTKRLLGFLNRVFDKDPLPFLALRLSYNGSMSWSIEEQVLRTVVDGGNGTNLVVDLSQYTIASLVGFLAAQTDYQVLYADGSEMAMLSARVLLDGGNNIASSNGDHLYGYTSVTWAYLDSVAAELKAAKLAIAQAPLQMATTTASEAWLDDLGGFYGVPRLDDELDAQYGPRIIAEVLRPRSNNVAIEDAIRTFTGQNAVVTDVVSYGSSFPLFNGLITFNGAQTFNAAPLLQYNLFDVEHGYDLLNGDDIAAFQQVVKDLINRLRAAGTHLRTTRLVGGELDDVVETVPTDAVTVNVAPVLEDNADAGQEEAFLNVSMNHVFDGVRNFDGTFAFIGSRTYVNGSLEDETTGDLA